VKILDEYVKAAPDQQRVLDVFAGEWSSAFPAKFGFQTKPGTAALFEDGRIDWAIAALGIGAGSRILELGPLEAGHSYMLQNAGAREVIAIEANTRAFLKCLCVKELLGLERVHFLLGDFVAYLKDDRSQYDAVIASGVLYHMDKPLELLELISRVAGKVMLWTHYYDADVLTRNKQLAHKFTPLQSIEHAGVTYEFSTQSYKEALGWAGFCGGPLPTSKWLSRDSIMRALTAFGFTTISVNFDDPRHPNGPAFAICAQKA
jgi:SAM-dependent methyltransferase